MIETPAYLYWTKEMPAIDDGALFHFTSFDSFIKIMETMTLRSSPLSRMNDLNEACLAFVDWSENLPFLIKAETHIKDGCSAISFTKNYMTDGGCQEGSNHPAMWAHYGDNSNGVCIVLDQESLIENNKELLSDYFYKLEDIIYHIDCSPDESIANAEYTSLSEFVSKNYKELFFKKHLDWAYERETRFFVETSSLCLNIKGAIKYIVLGGRMSKSEEKLDRIIEMMLAPESSGFQYLDLHSFAHMLPAGNGYLTVAASDIIFRKISKMASTSIGAKSYLDGCYNNGKISVRKL